MFKTFNSKNIAEFLLSKNNKYINFKPENYKPLVSKYIKGDFTNSNAAFDANTTGL